MQSIHEALAALSSAASAMFRMQNRDMKRQPTPGRKKSGKTRRGAIHTIGQVFKARKKFNGSPAQYRREHRGVVTITPNYKQKHAAPRARNVWTSN